MLFADRNWRDLEWLRAGTASQRRAAARLRELDIMTTLSAFDPVLAGSVPLGVDVDGSDLDILCAAADLDAFAAAIASAYGDRSDFAGHTKPLNGVASAITRFRHVDVLIEVVAQNRRVTDQVAFRHLVVEDRLLQLGGDRARRGVQKLKRAGLKTEPAFARYFHLDGDPYQTLLHLYECDPETLRAGVQLATRNGA